MRFEPIRAHFRVTVPLLTLGLLTLAKPARANVQACVDAHSEGQVRRDASDFMRAAELFQGCVDTSCPEPIRVECASFASKLAEQMPTVVLGAVDASGADVPNVSVEVDGKLFVETLTGRATPINPGSHELVFRTPDGTTATMTVLVLEGAKNRKIVARLAPATPTPVARAPSTVLTTASPRAERADKTLAYVLAGGGLVALGAFTYFAVSGSAREGELRDTCAPSCSKSDARAVGTKYLIADISLVLAAGLLGTGTYLYFTAPQAQKTGKRGLALGVTGRF